MKCSGCGDKATLKIVQERDAATKVRYSCKSCHSKKWKSWKASEL